jgi:hypothetical protein
MAQAVYKLLILEEAVLFNMATNPEFMKAFPFLSAIRKAAKISAARCNRCSRAAADRVRLIAGVKGAIVKLDPASKQKLKKMLGAEKIRVKYLRGNAVVELTF